MRELITIDEGTGLACLLYPYFCPLPKLISENVSV